MLLLDEITVDLDVLGRAQLMDFLKSECETRGATVIYATHIFDGLEAWPSHVAYLARGEMALFKKAEELPELREGRLLQMVGDRSFSCRFTVCGAPLVVQGERGHSRLWLGT